MAPEPRRPRWLPKTGPGNLGVPPEQWGMTLGQWAAFIVSCMVCEEKWHELIDSTDRKEKGYANLYQICDHYVKPWTRGLGNSIALLMNSKGPRKAEAMLSHAWGECMLESMVAVLGRAAVIGMSMDTVVWFCAFAQYQPGDEEGDCGPGVAAQLALDPFKRVIASDPPYGMVVIHTTRAELYGRLWCVYEVNESELCDVTPFAAVSMNYLKKICEDNPDGITDDHFQVDCENASCWSKDDESMIKGKIVEAGGYDKLNTKIQVFRAAAARRMYQVAKEFADWGKGGLVLDPQQAVQDLVEVVQAAARFLGLQCLAQLAQKDEDEAYGQVILDFARQEVSLWELKFSGMRGSKEPPFFDPSKGDADMPSDEEKLGDCLLSPEPFPFAVGLLEMGAGGNIMAVALDSSEISSRGKSVDRKTLKKVFKEWDTDGNGYITEKELTSVLMQLEPNFTDFDCQAMFRVSDKNRDGKVDYNEFIDWLTGGM